MKNLDDQNANSYAVKYFMIYFTENVIKYVSEIWY